MNVDNLTEKRKKVKLEEESKINFGDVLFEKMQGIFEFNII